MRILHIAPLWERVPPRAYGGTEAVASLLVDELVKRGHEVTLFASGDSVTSAQLRSVRDKPLWHSPEVNDGHIWDIHHAAIALESADGYDIVHNHAGEVVAAISNFVSTPVLSTLHCLVTPDSAPVWDRYRGWYNTISRAQVRTLPSLRCPVFAGVVYNAIDVPSFPFNEDKEDWLLFLSRIAPQKAPHLAIEIARRCGKRLVIAGKIDACDRAYFEEAVKPLIDGERVQFFGEADGRQKRELLARARALLVPIQWEEPFGLVFAEAMACGTPVLSCPRGAAPELVESGRTGFLGSTDELCDAVALLDRIDPRDCRARVEERFDVPVMASAYEALYESMLERSPVWTARWAEADSTKHVA